MSGGFFLRSFLSLCGLMLPLGVHALGLGELRSEAILGQPIAFDIELLGMEQKAVDASCFRLIQPVGGDLPWLQKAQFNVRSGQPPMLEIRSRAALNEPALQLAVYIGCGYELSRQFVVFAVPAGSNFRPLAAPVAVAPMPLRDAIKPRPALLTPDLPLVPKRLSAKRSETVPPSKGNIVPVPSSTPSVYTEGLFLRLATQLLGKEPTLDEAQRDILRLEFRMLTALHTQAMTQMETAEKLRTMEGTLSDLRQKSAEFATRVEKGGDIVPKPKPKPPVIQDAPLKQSAVAVPESSGFPWWILFGLLGGGLAGGAAWFGWKQYQARQRSQEFLASEPHDSSPETLIVHDDLRPMVSPVEKPKPVDFPFEHENAYQVTQLDFELEAVAPAREREREQLVQPTELRLEEEQMPFPPGGDVGSSEDVSRITPVLELAEIMLSFGRVKGAAQTLRDFLDAYPEESPVLWMRLLEVCYLADMPEEFEVAAREFNHYFNVELATWEEMAVLAGSSVAAERLLSLEDLPRLMAQIVDGWNTDLLLRYLDHLLRDNRGGERAGFPIPIVKDILFLIELKETIKQMERERHE